MLACPGRCATVRRQTAQRTSGSWVTVTGWRQGVELLISSILPAGSHSCPLQSVDAEQCRATTAGRRSAQASLAVQPLDCHERLDVADRIVHRIVVMRRDPEPLPVLGPAEVADQPGVVVADSPPGMAERVARPTPAPVSTPSLIAPSGLCSTAVETQRPQRSTRFQGQSVAIQRATASASGTSRSALSARTQDCTVTSHSSDAEGYR
jgi:predicted component of type VI protein secretion system